jgi:hypothetical protein
VFAWKSATISAVTGSTAARSVAITITP